MFRKREKGQSLIEVTFFLIILLILIAGTVELGAILQTKLMVVNSAREGARFGTVGASNDDITLITQQSASNVINYVDENADIWVIRIKTNTAGTIDNACPSDLDTADSYWCVGHEVGDGLAEPTFLTYGLVAGEGGLLKGIPDTEYIAVAVSYDHQSIIGLPYAVGGGGMPVNSYTIMRVESNEEYAGCYVWPIAVHTDTVDWYGIDGTPGHPNPTPLGDIFNGGGSGNFGWLRWNDDKVKGQPAPGSSQELARRLNDPKTSLGEFKNAADDSDTHLSVDDWVYGDTGLGIGNDVKTALNDLEGQRIRILVWDQVGDDSPPGGSCSGSNCSYHVVGFALVVLRDLDGDGQVWDVSGKNKSIEAEFIGFDDSCK